MKRGAPDHWKMKELARLAKVPARFGLTWANGCMERLWHYTGKFYLQGDIGKAPDEYIADACGWPAKDAAALIEALVGARWLDRDPKHRLLVHDWPVHCDDGVKKTLKNRGLPFLFPENSGTVQENSACLSLSLASALAFPQPKPEPKPNTNGQHSLTVSVNAPASPVEVPVQTTQPRKRKVFELTPEQEIWFAEFWSLYWRDKDKKVARSCFGKKVKTEEQWQKVKAAVIRQTKSMMSLDPERRPYASTWLNKDRFEDGDDPPPLFSGNTSHDRNQAVSDETFNRLFQKEIQRGSIHKS